MARGRKTSLTITLTPEERRTLLAWQRSTTIRSGLLRRARLILLVADGVAITTIAAMVGISRRFVYTWARRFQEQGVEGLTDKPRRGRSRRVPPQTPPQAQHLA
jgi:transposase